MAVSMDKRKLAAGVKEMRSVAKRLMMWADDLEMAGAKEVPEDADCPAVPAVDAPTGAGADDGKPAEDVKKEPAPVGPGADDKEPAENAKEEPAPEAPPTFAAVKKFLSEKCAAGYSAQVHALIGSFGAKTLSGVPAEFLGDLLDAAMLLGEEAEEAGEAHAG